MADLSKDTLLFAREQKRMCAAFKRCSGCELEPYPCALGEFSNSEMDEKRIVEAVQKWSDKNNGCLNAYKPTQLNGYTNVGMNLEHEDPVTIAEMISLIKCKGAENVHNCCKDCVFSPDPDKYGFVCLLDLGRINLENGVKSFDAEKIEAAVMKAREKR